METAAEEAARVRAEVQSEMDSEESGDAVYPQVVDDVPPAQNAPPADPWEGVSPALKQMFDEMSQRVVTLQATETRLKQAESRIGSITNELHQAKKAVETHAPTAAQMAAAAESDEKWESLKQDFPDWADAFDSRFDKKLTAQVNALRTELKAEMGTGATPQDELLRTFETKLLSVMKPKWRETIATNEWKEWLAIQPEAIRSLVSSENAEDAIKVLTSFEEAKPAKTATEIAAERKQRLHTAVLPTGGKAVPVKSEADMSASELRATLGKEIFAE